jgi:hypothetical protein
MLPRTPPLGEMLLPTCLPPHSNSRFYGGSSASIRCCLVRLQSGGNSGDAEGARGKGGVWVQQNRFRVVGEGRGMLGHEVAGWWLNGLRVLEGGGGGGVFEKTIRCEFW